MKKFIDDLHVLLGEDLLDIEHITKGPVEYFSGGIDGNYFAIIDGFKYGPYNIRGEYEDMDGNWTQQFVRKENEKSN